MFYMVHVVHPLKDTTLSGTLSSIAISIVFAVVQFLLTDCFTFRELPLVVSYILSVSADEGLRVRNVLILIDCATLLAVQVTSLEIILVLFFTQCCITVLHSLLHTHVHTSATFCLDVCRDLHNLHNKCPHLEYVLVFKAMACCAL